MQFDAVKKTLNDGMNKAIDSLKHQLTKIRTGRASATILDGLTVDYYGVPSGETILKMVMVIMPLQNLHRLHKSKNLKTLKYGQTLGMPIEKSGTVVVQ